MDLLELDQDEWHDQVFHHRIFQEKELAVSRSNQDQLEPVLELVARTIQYRDLMATVNQRGLLLQSFDHQMLLMAC